MCEHPLHAHGKRQSGATAERRGQVTETDERGVGGSIEANSRMSPYQKKEVSALVLYKEDESDLVRRRMCVSQEA